MHLHETVLMLVSDLSGTGTSQETTAVKIQFSGGKRKRKEEHN